MKLIHALLAVLVSLLLIILLAAVMPEVQDATGVPHPDHYNHETNKGMSVSKANINQVPHTRWLGYLFGLGVIGLFASFIFIGSRKKGRLTGISKWLTIGFGVYILAYTGMCVTHWNYTNTGEANFFIWMPTTTAWMIYGVWFVPLIITVAYVIGFERWIISPEEEADLHSFLQQHNQ